METFNLQTTQNVTLQYRIASVGDRVIATLLDFIFMGVYAGILTIIITQTPENVAPWLAALYFPIIFYHLIFEIFVNGQSPGKLIMRIKVVKADGTHLTIGAALIRWLFRILDVTLLFGGLAVIVIIINGKGQRLGDIAASTTVLKIPDNSDMQSTSWVEVHPNYKPMFPQAELLTDSDIRTIREVLALAVKKSKQSATDELLQQTRDAVVKKTSIHSDMPTRKLLYTLVKDYNAINKSMMAEISQN
ncbi:MAG TPA: RDD family protein [Marinilabiliaceae bacterium]|nr:RDD family protein [Marinilabiliaceae bacterium]HBX89604.1 RDD family protein [Marinilabiliaceae bacterium]